MPLHLLHCHCQILEYNVVPGEALTHADLEALAAQQLPLLTQLEGQTVGVSRALASEIRLCTGWSRQQAFWVPAGEGVGGLNSAPAIRSRSVHPAARSCPAADGA